MKSLRHAAALLLLPLSRCYLLGVDALPCATTTPALRATSASTAGVSTP